MFFAGKVIKCPDIDDPRYGDVVLSGRKPGSKATYTCDSGFNLVGAATRKCLLNGKWSGRAPVCKRKYIAIKIR